MSILPIRSKLLEKDDDYRTLARSPRKHKRRHNRRHRSRSPSKDKNKMRHGTVRKWLISRGFGFIVPNGGNKDIFVHNSCIQGFRRELNIGEKVTYFLRLGKNGIHRAEAVLGDGSGRPDEYIRSLSPTYKKRRRDDSSLSRGRDWSRSRSSRSISR